MTPDLVAILNAYEDATQAAAAANHPKPRAWQSGRSEWQRRQKERRAKTERCARLSAEVGSDGWDRVAQEHVTHVYLTTRVEGRQPRDFRVLHSPEEYDRRIAETQQRAPIEDVRAERPMQQANRVYMIGSDYTVTLPVAQLPELHERVSDPMFVERAIRTFLTDVRSVALDPTMLTATGATYDGGHRLVVQHKASGLRASFNESSPRPFYGAYSKPYKIRSIDPDRQEDPGSLAEGWRDWVGMGIGTRIYLHAASVLPEARFFRSMTSDYSRPLRSRLHAQDPFRWENGGDCDWCRKLDWRDPGLTRGDFNSHPQPE